jgi:protease II
MNPFWLFCLLRLSYEERSLKCVSPRKFGLRYDVEHIPLSAERSEDFLVIVTNKDEAKNNKLMSVGINRLGGTVILKLF